MLFKLFKRPQTFFKIAIHISRNSFVESIENFQSPKKEDLILLSLLTYARILQIMSPSKANDLAQHFIDLKEFQNKIQDFKKLKKHIESSISLMKNTYGSEKILKVTCAGQPSGPRFIKASNIGLIGNANVESYAYTIFIHAWEQLDYAEKIKLFEGFAFISSAKVAKKLTITTASSIPNNFMKEFELIDSLVDDRM